MPELRFWLFLATKVDIPFQVIRSLFGDLIPRTGGICYLDQTCFLKLRKPSFYRRVRDRVAFKTEIYLKTALVQRGSRIGQELQDDVISPGHPWSSETPGHIRSAIPSPITWDDLPVVEQFVSIYDQFTGQDLSCVTKNLFTATDAALRSRQLPPEKRGSRRPWNQHGRRVGPSRTVCNPTMPGTKTVPLDVLDRPPNEPRLSARWSSASRRPSPAPTAV